MADYPTTLSVALFSSLIVGLTIQLVRRVMDTMIIKRGGKIMQ